MKSFLIQILILASLILYASCSDLQSPGASQSNQDSIVASMTKAKNSGEKVEGKFLNIEKLTGKTYNLSIQLSQDSVAVFETLMPLDGNEIKLLKKEGNNIILTYKVYENPVTKQEVKMVQYMQPIYEVGKK